MADTRPARGRSFNVRGGMVGRGSPGAPGAARRDADSFWEAIRSGVNGTVDSLPMEAGNYLPAGARAIGAAALLHDPRIAFARQLAAESERDRQDEQEHPTARTLGKVAGTVAQVALPGMGITRIAGGARRMVQASRATATELRNIAALGAAGGLGSQGISDAAHGKLSPAADYAGSAAGGSAGALAALLGRPGLAAGISGAATSLAQDSLNHRIGSIDEARAAVDRGAEGAAAANALAAPIGKVVARAAHRLPARIPAGATKLRRGFAGIPIGLAPNKGELGEQLSALRSILRGERINRNAPYYLRLSKGRTVPDLWTDVGPVESKFGVSYRYLKKNQARAYKEVPNYRLDSWLPDDVGILAELPAASAGYHGTHVDPGFPGGPLAQGAWR